MKKLINFAACLVFVFLLTGVSFAKSEDTEITEKTVLANACSTLAGDQCDNATALAMSVSYDALVICASSGSTSTACSTANANAAQSQKSADFICKNEVQPVVKPAVPLEAVHSPTKKESSDKIKTLDTKQSFGDASAR